MKRRICAVMAVGILCGCTTARKQMYASDDIYEINCSSWITTISNCYAKAEALCGNRGYTVVKEAAGKWTKRLTVQCKPFMNDKYNMFELPQSNTNSQQNNYYNYNNKQDVVVNPQQKIRQKSDPEYFEEKPMKDSAYFPEGPSKKPQSDEDYFKE